MAVSISIDTDGVVSFDMDLLPPKTVRDFKGANMMEFPTSYCVIDVETTGFSPAYDSIIEVAALKVENDVVVSSFTSLVKPFTSSTNEYVDEYITNLTGITNEMLATAPDTKTVLKDFIDFIGDAILVGHNVHFDINFLYDNCLDSCSHYLKNDFVDTMRIFRRSHRELEHHRLDDLANFYGVERSQVHRSLADCEATYHSYIAMKKEVLENDISLELPKRKPHASIHAKDISITQTIANDTPFYGKVCVFTGALEKMLRKDAMQLIANLGGINGDSVTSKTNFLILGNNDYCASIKDGKSSKHKKAEQLILKGQDIQIIPETVFYDMVNEFI